MSFRHHITSLLYAVNAIKAAEVLAIICGIMQQNWEKLFPDCSSLGKTVIEMLNLDTFLDLTCWIHC